MTTRMLIDARHPEETRVAVVQNNRIEEFDFESADHKQIKGNIFLAKVTRVEPSLQAAFIDYGGNRHGFLAFSEIHPDYYQIPKADRDALLQEEAEHAAEEERLRAEEDARHDDPDDDFEHDEDYDFAALEAVDGDPQGGVAEAVASYVDPADAHGEDHSDAHGEDHSDAHGDEHAADAHADELSDPEGSDDFEPANGDMGGGGGRRGGSQADELRKKRQALRRRYKIQDVIHRRQVLLVQVVKEERGNKGAALTTYLSLAGRYCVLMPNTSSGGGISRKISNGADRKRLKSIMADLQLPKSMGCIVRTAGLQRSQIEIKRDFDYLARMWDEIREKTLSSSAPALIYGDSDLIKRAIRDIYNKEIDEIIVEGEASFRAARTFMKLLMPTHARKIQPYQDTVPLFQRYGVEDQLSAMYQPVVQLKSGGYLVINPTEALVSIDINSGRSTREHNIEQTAYATNIEAAHEIARQLRLRDMAGLVVIDFIDMESSGHIRKVEKAMKDALRNDRARIQVGRISGFGLLEMSRQRLRTGVLEASTRICEHCEGTGLMRTAASAGLSALRMLEDEAARGRGDRLCLRAGREAAIYVLNKKRREIGEVEARYGVQIEVMIDAGLEGARMQVESSGNRPIPRPQLEAPAQYEDDDDDLLPLEEEEPEAFATEAEEDGPDTMRSERPERGRSGRDDEDASGRKRRRRRSRGARRDGAPSLAPVGEEVVSHDAIEDADGEGELDEAIASDEIDEAEGAAARGDEGEGGARRRRGRRGRRGGRGRSGEGAERVSADADASVENGGVADRETADTDEAFTVDTDEAFDADAVAVTEPLLPEDADVGIAAIAPGESRSEETGVLVEDAREAQAALAEEERPKTRRRPRAKKPVGDEAAAATEAAPVADAPDTAETVTDAPPAKPKRTRRKAADVAAAALEQTLPLAPSQVGVLDDGPTSTEFEGTVNDGEANADASLETASAASSAGDAGPTTAADAASAEEAPAGEPARSRSGWWQRTFG